MTKTAVATDDHDDDDHIKALMAALRAAMERARSLTERRRG